MGTLSALGPNLPDARKPDKPNVKIIDYPGVPRCPGLWREEGKTYRLLNGIFILMSVIGKAPPSVTACVPPQGSLLWKVLGLSSAKCPQAEPATQLRVPGHPEPPPPPAPASRHPCLSSVKFKDRTGPVVLKMQPPELLQHYHLGACQKRRFPGPTLDLLSQKLWEWGPAVCCLADPPAALMPRTSGLDHLGMPLPVQASPREMPTEALTGLYPVKAFLCCGLRGTSPGS